MCYKQKLTIRPILLLFFFVIDSHQWIATEKYVKQVYCMYTD